MFLYQEVRLLPLVSSNSSGGSEFSSKKKVRLLKIEVSGIYTRLALNNFVIVDYTQN